MLFHFCPCLMPISPSVVAPLDNVLTITLVPIVKLSPSVCTQSASVVTISLFTTLTLGVAGRLNSKLKLDLGIETLGRGTFS